MTHKILTLLALTSLAPLYATEAVAHQKLVEAFTSIITSADCEIFKHEFIKVSTQAHFHNLNMRKLKKELLKISRQQKTAFETELQAIGNKSTSAGKIARGSALLTGGIWCGINTLAHLYCLPKKDQFRRYYESLGSQFSKDIALYIILGPTLLSWTVAHSSNFDDGSIKLIVSIFTLSCIGAWGLSSAGITTLAEGLNYKRYLQTKIKNTNAIIEYLTNFA